MNMATPQAELAMRQARLSMWILDTEGDLSNDQVQPDVGCPESEMMYFPQ